MMSNILMTRMSLSKKMIGFTKVVNKSIIRSTSSTTSTNNYFEKNERLQRPLSPILIYKPQITTVMSITHRMTGLALATLLYGGGIAALGSQKTNFAQVLQTVSTSVPSSIILTLKLLTATSIVYHTLNGLRHLAWDMGYGFNKSEYYTSGYIVLGLSLLSVIGFVLANN